MGKNKMLRKNNGMEVGEDLIKSNLEEGVEVREAIS